MQRDSHINHIHGHLCGNIGDRSAAALVYLPSSPIWNAMPSSSNNFRSCAMYSAEGIIGSALSSGTRVLKNAGTIAKERRIILFADRGEVGIERSRHIGRQHLRRSQCPAQLHF